MNKIYFDASKKLEVCDISGIKDIETLKLEFSAPNLVDITAERETKNAQDRADAEARAAIDEPREKLINEKIRDMAIAELTKEGKL